MAFDREKILSQLKTNAAVHLYDSIDSTNNEAKRRAFEDEGVHLYAAEHQTAGRGRRGRSFYSPAGTGLYMTLSLPCSGAPEDLQRVTCAAAVAVCEAIERLGAIRPRIKWVNDIYVGEKKTAGILTELVTDSDNRPVKVIVGVGVNLTTADFPAQIAAIAGSLGAFEPEALCSAIADKLTALYGDLGNNSIIEKYKQRDLCIGRTVRYCKDGTEHTARAVDIAPSGALIVEENGARTVLSSGEISVKMNTEE